MGFRIAGTNGIVDRAGMVFMTICILTTSIAILFGMFIARRGWFSFCPMGMLHRVAGRGKYKLKVDRELCIKCKKC